MKTRKYRLARRADSQQETRERIIAATVKLHEQRGPRAASISAIAAAAGVQRLTVYRHFPNEEELFRACTSQWLRDHPPPAPASWAHIVDERIRIRTALLAMYRYYRATAKMWSAAHRDEALVPAMQGPMQEFRTYLQSVAAELGAATGRRRIPRSFKATLLHALQFATWQSLADSGLNDASIAALTATWIDAVGPAGGTSPAGGTGPADDRKAD